jgi:two-component system, cell cycle response regulator
LEAELDRSRRYQTPLAILMLDIDDFKKINDRYGHQIGDQALKHVTMKILEAIRKVDSAGRYGGEEFLVVLPQASQATAADVAERIRDTLDRTPLKISSGELIPIHVTLGVAALPHPKLADRLSFLRAADEALYAGKRQGKNRVLLHGDPLF